MAKNMSKFDKEGLAGSLQWAVDGHMHNLGACWLEGTSPRIGLDGIT